MDFFRIEYDIDFLAGHPYFVATQYHPEFLSRPVRPSAPFLGLVLAASGRDEIRRFLSRTHRYPQLLDVLLAQQAVEADSADGELDIKTAATPTKHSATRRSAFDRREAALAAFRHDDDDDLDE